MSRKNRRGRTLLARLQGFRQHTKVTSQILRDLLVIGVSFSTLGAALHQLVSLLR